MPAELARILCADDEDDILVIINMCLGMIPDLEIASCSDGVQALAMAQEVKPDLVLLDVMMPGADGPMTMQQMHADPALRDIPVILMTARVQPAEIEEYKAMGAIGVIPKPFDPMTLADDVVAIWDQYNLSKDL